MLLKEATIIKPVKAGKNIAAIKESGRRKVETSRGSEYRPVYTGEFVDGLPFGESVPEIKAPIDLQIGDVVRVEADDYLVWDVDRSGAVVWANKPLQEQEESRRADARRRQEFKDMVK